MADTPDLSAMINKLTEDPETLGKIMNMASSIMGNMNNNDSSPSPSEDSSKIADESSTKTSANADSGENLNLNLDFLPTLLNGLGGKQKGDSRAALLLALKPYMSNQRAEKIDMMVKAMKLADLAGGFLGGSGLFG